MWWYMVVVAAVVVELVVAMVVEESNGPGHEAPHSGHHRLSKLALPKTS